MQKNKPAVILVRPQLPENIGAVARAMTNFGLSDLRLVAPREGWPQRRARETASGGEAVIDAAKAYKDFPSAMADIQIAYAATSRERDMEKRAVTPEGAVEEIGDDAKIAFVFGPERTGLENEEIVLCNTLITIPTAPGHASLNLAQSVAVLGYEWFKRDLGLGIRDWGKKKTSSFPESPITNPQSLASKADWQGLFDQLEAYLDEADYFRVAHKKPLMWQNLRNTLLRATCNVQEIRSLRGALRAIYESRQMRAGRKRSERKAS